MERNEKPVRTLGTIRIENLDSPRVLSLTSLSEPERELVPGILQPTERRWLAAMVDEVIEAHERFSQSRKQSIHLPDRSDLALPKPRDLHPIDHFGRAWNVFTQAVEMMGGYVFFCDGAGREIMKERASSLPHLSLCLRFR